MCVWNPTSRLLQIGHKLEKCQWRPNFTTWHHFQIFLTLFYWSCKVCYWSKFHVNIMTGSGVMTISFYKRLTRNPEIRNTPVWVFSNICKLGQVKNTKFGTNLSNKMSLNAAKCQSYSFYRFWVIKENQIGGEVKLPPSPSSHSLFPHTQIRVNQISKKKCLSKASKKVS